MRKPPPEIAEVLEALEDMWWQFGHPVGPNEQWRSDAGLSALETATDVLERAGRIERVANCPDKDWFALVQPASAEVPHGE